MHINFVLFCGNKESDLSLVFFIVITVAVRMSKNSYVNKYSFSELSSFLGFNGRVYL